jgi:hypothetical protein
MRPREHKAPAWRPPGSVFLQVNVAEDRRFELLRASSMNRSRGLHGSGTRILASGPRGLTPLADAEPAVIIAAWLICPARERQAPGHTTSSRSAV